MPRQKEQSHTTRPLSTSAGVQTHPLSTTRTGSKNPRYQWLFERFSRTVHANTVSWDGSITRRQLSAFHPLQPSNLFPLRLIENSLARSFNQGKSAILHHWSLDWRRQTANLYQAQEPAETVPTPPRRALCVCHSDQCFPYLPGSLITNPSFY